MFTMTVKIVQDDIKNTLPPEGVDFILWKDWKNFINVPEEYSTFRKKFIHMLETPGKYSTDA